MAKLVAAALGAIADAEGNCINLSPLVDMTGLSRAEIAAELRYLESSRAIIVNRRGGSRHVLLQPARYVQPAGMKSLACPLTAIVDTYHATLPKAPHCLKMTTTRAGLIRSRWREYQTEKGWDSASDGLEFFRRYFEHVSGSKFLTGRIPSSDGRPPFVADLEWLMRPSNFARIIEGHYHRG